MEADWSETARLTLPGPSPNAPSTPITAFAFDTAQELLWTGNEYVSESIVSFLYSRPRFFLTFKHECETMRARITLL